MSLFNSIEWKKEKQLELVNLIFKNEFDIDDFKNTDKILNFDDLQSPNIKDKVNKYRLALSYVFTSEELRSVLDYYYLEKDKKPVLNLLKQKN